MFLEQRTLNGERLKALSAVACPIGLVVAIILAACLAAINCFPELRPTKPEPSWIPPQFATLQEHRGASRLNPEVIMAQAVGTPKPQTRAAKPKQVANAAESFAASGAASAPAQSRGE